MQQVVDGAAQVRGHGLERGIGLVHEGGHAHFRAAVVEAALLQRLADVAGEAPRAVAGDEELGGGRVDVHGRDQDAGLAVHHHLRNAVHIARHDRQTRVHGLGQRQAEGLPE